MDKTSNLTISPPMTHRTEIEKELEAARGRIQELERELERLEGTENPHSDTAGNPRSEDPLSLGEKKNPSFSPRFAVVGSDFRFQFANVGYAEWFGLNPKEVVGKLVWEILGKPAFEGLKPRMEAALAGREQVFEKKIVYRGLGPREVQIFYMPRFGEGGKPDGLYAAISDITDRKKAEEALQEKERFLRVLTDSVPISISYIDAERRYRFANSSHIHWMGKAPEDYVGMRMEEVLPPDTFEAVRPFVEKVLASGERVDFETSIARSPEKIRLYRGIYVPHKGKEGEVVGFSSMMEDRTDYNKIEQQLRESQKMDAVGQLAGGIAHDFNNALQVIINSADFIKKHPDKKETVNEFLDLIQKSGLRAAELTRKLLAFSRKNPIQPKVLDLNDMTGELIKLVKRILGEHIELEFQRGEPLGKVKADRGMLEQVILNLCVNARDAMPKGGRLTISTLQIVLDETFCQEKELEHPGDYVLLAVSDTGAGVPLDKREKIFEPFFTTKEVGEGTGLGLAMAYGIVRQHHGHIEVNGAAGEGSTFNIYLPVSEVLAKPIDKPALAPRTGGHEKILVAEDEEVVRSLLARLLESEGYQVLTAKDGQEALEVFDANWPGLDLVILDMVMPKLRGREVFHKIRERGGDMPVIFSTGYSPDTSDLDFVGHNDLTIVQKPYTPEELYRAVRTSLSEAKK